MPSIDDSVRDILFGGASGAVGKLVEYPFDTVKVRLQTQSIELFPTTWSCIKYTYRNEGVLGGFYKGLSSPLFGAFLENAVLFVSYNRAMQFASKHSDISPLSKTVYAGAFAGACASFVLTPVELVKCKLQVSNLDLIGLPNTQNTVFSTVRTLVKKKGIAGLWQGQSSTFVRECVGGAIWFTTYEVTKSWLASRHDNKTNRTWELLVAGGCAGLGFNASIFPVDTIKSTMQTKHISISSAISLILRNNGISGLYRGIGITLARAVPANSVIFYMYETLKSL